MRITTHLFCKEKSRIKSHRVSYYDTPLKNKVGTKRTKCQQSHINKGKVTGQKGQNIEIKKRTFLKSVRLGKNP